MLDLRRRRRLSEEELVSHAWRIDFSGLVQRGMQLPAEALAGVPAAFHRDGCYEDSLYFSRRHNYCDWGQTLASASPLIGVQFADDEDAEDGTATDGTATDGTEGSVGEDDDEEEDADGFVWSGCLLVISNGGAHRVSRRRWNTCLSATAFPCTPTVFPA